MGARPSWACISVQRHERQSCQSNDSNDMIETVIANQLLLPQLYSDVDTISQHAHARRVWARTKCKPAHKQFASARNSQSIIVEQSVRVRSRATLAPSQIAVSARRKIHDAVERRPLPIAGRDGAGSPTRFGDPGCAIRTKTHATNQVLAQSKRAADLLLLSRQAHSSRVRVSRAARERESAGIRRWPCYPQQH